MVDFSILGQSIMGISQILQGGDIAAAGAELQAQALIQGGEVAAQGALLSADGYRQSAKAVRQSTGFNLGVQNLNYKRRLGALSRNFQRTVSSQIAAQAGSGFSLGSGSFLSLQSETAQMFTQGIKNFKIDFENQKRATLYESQIRQVQLENQARAAEYQAAAERVLASNRAAEARFQGEVAQYKAASEVAQRIPSLLSQVFE